MNVFDFSEDANYSSNCAVGGCCPRVNAICFVFYTSGAGNVCFL